MARQLGRLEGQAAVDSREVALDLCREVTLRGGEVEVERVGRLEQCLPEADEFLLALRRPAERLFKVVRQRKPDEDVLG